MLCPNDQTELKIADRQGIEIDYCPQCRGVWLDRGELDKIIERSLAGSAAARPMQPPPLEREPYREWRRDDDDDDDEYYRRTGRRRRRGWLGDLFDFD